MVLPVGKGRNLKWTIYKNSSNSIILAVKRERFVFEEFENYVSLMLQKCTKLPTVKVDGYTSLFFCPFYKGKQWTDFLFALSYDLVLPKHGLLFKERICSSWSKFFPLRVDPNLCEAKKKTTRLLPLKVKSFTLKFKLYRQYETVTLNQAMTSIISWHRGKA